MSRSITSLFFILVAAIAGAAQQPQQPPLPASIGAAFERSLTGAERQFVSAAEEMAADKYGFAPQEGEFEGVRTYAEQIKHVAAVNYILGAAILGEKPPVEVGEESGPPALKGKEEIMKYLRDSFAYAKKAVATLNAENAIAPVASPFGNTQTTRTNLATIAVAHVFDHYGQMVVYLRMNGIVPPASRR